MVSLPWTWLAMLHYCLTGLLTTSCYYSTSAINKWTWSSVMFWCKTLQLIYLFLQLIYVLLLTLDLNHLFDVQVELILVAANWKSIGLLLRLKPDVLENIDTKYSGNPHVCLSAMVKEWLIRNYNRKVYGEPTWQRLVEVVGHPAGGANMELARDMATRHKAEHMSSKYPIVNTTWYHFPVVTSYWCLHAMKGHLIIMYLYLYIAFHTCLYWMHLICTVVSPLTGILLFLYAGPLEGQHQLPKGLPF